MNAVVEFQDCLNMAQELLATKIRDNYYAFKFISEELDEGVVYSNPLNDKEVARLRALKENYGKSFVEHLDEVFDDSDTVHDFTYGDELYNIDLDHIIHKYSFTIHELKPDGTVYPKKCKLELSDSNYAKLVAWHILDDHFTINVLRLRDRSLYDTLMREVDQEFCYKPGFLEVDNPYLVTLDEAKADADLIVARRGMKRTNSYLYIEPF